MKFFLLSFINAISLRLVFLVLWMNFNCDYFPINSIVEKIYSCFMFTFLEVFTVLFRGFSPFFILISSGSFFAFMHFNQIAYKKITRKENQEKNESRNVKSFSNEGKSKAS